MDTTKAKTPKTTKTVKKVVKKVKKTTTPTTTPATPPEPVASEPVAPTPVAPESTTEPVAESAPVQTEAEAISQAFKDSLARLSALSAEIKLCVTEVKKLDKRVAKVVKDANKKTRKRVNNTANAGDKPKRAPSGFAKPSKISSELCEFLKKPLGTEMARTEVTKYVTTYIKDHGLQNPENKRHIIPDVKLGKLLKTGGGDEVTYFNLQKYMKHHFPKTAPTKA